MLIGLYIDGNIIYILCFNVICIIALYVNVMEFS